MHEIHTQKTAEDDLVDIWLFSFEQWGPEQADRYIDALNEGIRGLSDNPYLGKDFGDVREGYRCLRVEQHLVLYRVGPTQIQIVRVLHKSMLPKKHL